MKSKTLLLAVCIFIINYQLSIINCFAQGTWIQKADFGGTGRMAASGFSIGTKGYIGIGVDATFSTFFVDFWEWDKSTNVWTQKANYPGCSGATATSFSIGTKGYIATGQNTCGGGWTNDLWEYNPSLNNWSQKATLPGTPTRAWAAGFSIGSKGYIGTGGKDWGSPIVHYDDLWEWDQIANTWTQKASYPGGAREYAAAFSIGTKGYIGTGMDNSVNPAIEIVTNDFWEWDQATNTWLQKADFPGTARGYANGFSIGTKGYIGMGMDTAFNGYNDVWEWDQSGNAWTKMADFPGGTALTTAFSIGTNGYVGTGTGASGASQTFWQFTPNCNIVLNINTTNSSCGNATGTASVVATGGTAPYTYAWTNGDKTSLADSLSAGLYMVLVTDASGCTDTKPAMINDAGAPVITVNTVTDVTCNGGNNGAITINVTGGSQPYTYFWANGNTNQNMSNLQAGPHQIQVTDANGCVAMKIVLVNEPAKITLTDSVQNASCGSNDGSITVFVSGGTSPYSYLWNPSAATTSTATGLIAGGYVVTVTDNNGCTKSGMETVSNSGAATAVVDSFIPADCASGLGAIYISVTGGTPPYTYVWTNGATTQDLVGVPAGMYGVTIYSNGNPCTGAFSGVLPAKAPYTPSICIVTVDTATGKNQCAFTKDSILNLSLKQYNFYRETTTAGVYQKLGSKAANLLSLWTDQSANPLQRAWRYKITSEDSCGNEALISVMHKTIHLAANLGLNNTVNLMWDNYEGFSYPTFIIWRYDPASGWDSLDAVPSNLNSYTDLTPPTPLVNVNYFIEVIPPSVCTASIAHPDDARQTPERMVTNLNSSRSNIYKINSTATAVSEMPWAEAVTVYPNPSYGKFQVSSPKSQVSSLEVYNIYGEKVYSLIQPFTHSLIDISSQPNGIYFLQLKSEDGVVTKKIVINK